MVVDPDLLQSECLLAFLTGTLRASEVTAKRVKEYKIMANFISKEKKRSERRNERRMEMKVYRRATVSLRRKQRQVRGTSPSLTCSFAGSFEFTPSRDFLYCPPSSDTVLVLGNYLQEILS
jgi:hypothetical protein